MDDDAYQNCWQMWRASCLFQKGLVADIVLPSVEDLVEIEDPSSDSVPSFSGPRHTPSRPERIFQIGQDAASKLLKAIVEGVTSKALLLVDLTVRSADLLKGFLAEKFQGDIPNGRDMYYLGFAETELEATL